MKQLTKAIASDNNPFVKSGLLRRIELGQPIYVFDSDEVIPRSKFTPVGTCRQGIFARALK